MQANTCMSSEGSRAHLRGIGGRLVDNDHSAIVIEGDLNVIAQADWVIDLGPEGGDVGGRFAPEGTPGQVLAPRSHTGVALLPVLARRQPGAVQLLRRSRATALCKWPLHQAMAKR